MSTYVHDNKSINVYSNGDLVISNKLKKAFYNIAIDNKDNLFLGQLLSPEGLSMDNAQSERVAFGQVEQHSVV